jgi:hypothetical protein
MKIGSKFYHYNGDINIMKYKILVLILGLLMAMNVGAHSGRTDASGCHKDSSTGKRHCHPTTPTDLSPTPTSDPTPTPKSTQVDLQPLVNSTWKFTYTLTNTYTAVSCGNQFDTTDDGNVFLVCSDDSGQVAVAGYEPNSGIFLVMINDSLKTSFAFKFEGDGCHVTGVYVAYALDPNFAHPYPLTGVRTDCPANTNTSTGFQVTDNLWIKAIIGSIEKGRIDAVWKLGSSAKTLRGDRVIWGYFYANPADVSWGSENNPDVFVKVWYDVSGRVDVNFFHVSVPDIEVTSAMLGDVSGQSNVITMSKRYARHTYGQGTPSSELLSTPEVPSGPADANPRPNLIGVQIGTFIQTQERGAVNGVWRLGGSATTSRGDQVAWGFFYASPSDVSWGFENNPEVYVKIWYDAIAMRVDVNFFHVSVPDIRVYSGFSDGNYKKGSKVTTAERYTRHEYRSEEMDTCFDICLTVQRLNSPEERLFNSSFGK